MWHSYNYLFVWYNQKMTSKKTVDELQQEVDDLQSTVDEFHAVLAGVNDDLETTVDTEK